MTHLQLHKTPNLVSSEPGAAQFVISIPQSQTGPHQAPDNKYYKRFALEVRAMEDYEIRDVMRRSTTPHLYAHFTFVDGADRKQLEFASSKETSDPIRLIGTIGNRSPQPAHYAMIKVGISSSIGFHRAVPWIFGGAEETDDFGKLNWLSQVFNVPPALPIFQELEQPLDQQGIFLSFSARTMAQSHRWPILVEIVCPGFKSREAWFIQQQGSNLRLLPPGHPLLR